MRTVTIMALARCDMWSSTANLIIEHLTDWSVCGMPPRMAGKVAKAHQMAAKPRRPEIGHIGKSGGVSFTVAAMIDCLCHWINLFHWSKPRYEPMYHPPRRFTYVIGNIDAPVEHNCVVNFFSFAWHMMILHWTHNSNPGQQFAQKMTAAVLP